MFFICRLIEEVVIFTFSATNVKPFKERSFPVPGRFAPREDSVSVMGLEQGP